MPDNVTAVTWPQRVDALAAIHPAAVALSTTARGGETLRWEDLAEASRRTAAGLLGLGVRPGDVVCVELPSRAAHVVCAHAAWRAGATVLPLRPDLPERERERILAAARPAVVIVGRPPVAAGEVTVGLLDAEGYLYIADRRTGMIVSGGANVRDYCKEHIAAYKVPRTFEIVDDLGRSESGKLNRRSLAEAREPEPPAEGGRAAGSARESDIGVQPRRDDGRPAVQSLVEPPEPAV
ncbi:AMP-binding protein [Parafrankia elaeagni]|uniref:AMP-binding protein n=1 Tax=Parafrankia elaeagni TaxID=222534 RepID=UPI001E303801|nr:AMP-binding protein [Parafrankia elaeagni]